MQQIERISFQDTLPAGFFSITSSIYDGLDFGKQEDQESILKLFLEESERNEIIIYTDHTSIRLVGIFPKEGTEAYFGFWETRDDLSLNRIAFEYLQDDAQKRHATRIIGPVNFTTYQSYRIRLSTPTWNKFDQEPVNPVYYPAILNALGFDKEISFESRMIKQADIPGVYLVKEDLLKAFESIPFDRIPVTPETWSQYEKEIFELVQVVFSANPFYKSVSYNQFTTLYNESFAARLCPYSSVLFKDKASGRLSSLSFCQPNYESLKVSRDHKYTYNKDFQRLSHKVLLVKTVGVHPDFRQQGLMNFMAAYAMFSFRDLYEEVIFCMTREDNISNNFTRYLPYEKAEYALFKKPLQ